MTDSRLHTPHDVDGEPAPTKAGPAPLPADAPTVAPEQVQNAPSTVADQEPKPARAGNWPEIAGYEIIRELGRGGMGAVFLATDTRLRRRVAIKVPFLRSLPRTGVAARFLAEARAAAALSHPNICPIYEFGESGGTPYLVMPCIQGERLLEPGQRQEPWEPTRAAALIRKIALAMDEAHRSGVIHRDLKPGNVIIDTRGEPIIMDFGVARRDDVPLTLRTQQGDVLGTPAYMSPEQITGDVNAMGPACDIYSLGVMLFELLTARRPFEGDLLSLASQVTSDPAPPPSRWRPGLDPRLDAISLHALAKRPQDRWPSMRAMADALEPCCVASGLAELVPVGDVAAGDTGLTLRIVGSTLAFRARPGQKVITVGRQRPRPGQTDGNDLVLRVPGNDRLTARISRKHLEICFVAPAWYVVDWSKGGTLLNDAPLTPGVPTRLDHGDKIAMAGVIVLEAKLRMPGQGKPAAAKAQVGAAVLEVSMGDLITFE